MPQAPDLLQAPFFFLEWPKLSVDPKVNFSPFMLGSSAIAAFGECSCAVEQEGWLHECSMEVICTPLQLTFGTCSQSPANELQAST